MPYLSGRHEADAGGHIGLHSHALGLGLKFLQGGRHHLGRQLSARAVRRGDHQAEVHAVNHGGIDRRVLELVSAQSLTVELMVHALGIAGRGADQQGAVVLLHLDALHGQVRAALLQLLLGDTYRQVLDSDCLLSRLSA